MEDNKQLILEGQLHVALQTIGKEACSLAQKEVSLKRLHTFAHIPSFLTDLKAISNRSSDTDVAVGDKHAYVNIGIAIY